MSKGVLKIATCQFAVGRSILRNAQNIMHYMRQARFGHADLIHFPECALSGYAGDDLASPDEIDWPLLGQKFRQIQQLARQLQLWTVLGSTHPLTYPHLPHNSLYVIDPRGRIHDRYDKRFCTERDLKYYSPGSHFAIFDVHGVRCSLLICFDLRFPEIYRALKKENVDCIIQSFYNARQKKRSIHTDIMRQTMQAHAACNYFWVSLSNSSAWYSPYPSCFIRPDGRIINQLRFHRPGLMVNTVDLRQKFIDLMAPFRRLALAGILSNGPALTDPCSLDKTSL